MNPQVPADPADPAPTLTGLTRETRTCRRGQVRVAQKSPWVTREVPLKSVNWSIEHQILNSAC